VLKEIEMKTKDKQCVQAIKDHQSAVDSVFDMSFLIGKFDAAEYEYFAHINCRRLPAVSPLGVERDSNEDV